MEAKIYPRAIVIGKVEIGIETIVDDFCFIYGAGGGVSIGKFSHICVRSTLMSGSSPIIIGSFVAISPSCTILSASDAYDGSGLIGHPLFKKYRNIDSRPVLINDHCHIGMGSLIMPGVILGEGCSIGAGSLVTKNMPPWSICYGSPCKVAKSKDKEKQLRLTREFLAEYYKNEYIKSESLESTLGLEGVMG